MLLEDDKNDASSGDFSTLNSYSSSTVSSGVSTSVMNSLNNSNNSVAAVHHDDHDGHSHAPNEISAAGVTWSASAGPVSTDPYYINALKSGAVWTNNGTGLNLNYKFWTATPSYYGAGDAERVNFQQFTASMKAATIQILGNISNIINVNFTQVAADASAQLGFAQAKLAPGAGAWAYYPGSYGQAGDVWTNNDYAASTQDMTLGRYGYQTIIHEIGHALGLKHSFEGPVSLSGAEDTSRYSVMSYTWPFYAESFMLYDIAALQKLYGANTSYAAGNDTYTLSSGHAYTIWDGGGTDTMDGSTVTSNMTINLNEGTYSSVGMTQNIAIAFGVEMENAVGGSGNDTITGNALDNNIQGGNGNDTIYGSVGDDTLDGGAGTDTLIYNYSIQDFLISLAGSTGAILTHNVLGTQNVENIENFVFTNITASLADLAAYASGNIAVMNIRVVLGAATYNFDSMFTGNRTINNTNIGGRGTAVGMYQLDRPDDHTLTVNVLSGTATGRLELTADNGGSNITLAGIHKNMVVNFTGRNGDDTFTANLTITGNDTIRMGGGADTAYAGNGNDTVYGDDGNDTLHGQLGNDIMYGGNGNDTITGGDGNEKIYGDAGNDTITGDVGNDYLYGGADNDTISGGVGNDYLYGEAGDDVLNGNDGSNVLYGGDGNDTMNGGIGIDKMYGDAGNDTLNGDAGNDVLYGGLGNDTMNGGLGNDSLYGEAGDDILNGGDGNNTVYGGDGDDTLTGGTGLDKLYGDAGNDTISGGAGNDTIIGGLGNDTLNGEDGNDTLTAGDGNDALNGGNGIDRLTAEAGDDVLNGGDGNDMLLAGLGNDRLYGDGGNDSLTGDAGNDVLVGGAGLDTLVGGTGSDTFGLNVLDGMVDLFKDFMRTGVDADKINITDILSGYDSLTDNINDFVRLASVTSRGATLQINHDGTGSDWVNGATITGSSFVGVTVDSLVASGQLIANQTLA